MTYSAFGNTFVIYLDPVSSKDLQVKLELLHDRKNDISEHLETSFGGFMFNKIFNLMQVLKALLCRSENAKYVRTAHSAVVYHQVVNHLVKLKLEGLVWYNPLVSFPLERFLCWLSKA